jgi:protein involved in polysaccharide export with SLBB domain
MAKRALLFVLLLIAQSGFGQTVADLRLKPGDRLDIQFEAPDLIACRVVIANNGTVRLPVVGVISAAGKTLPQMEDSLAQLGLTQGLSVRKHGGTGRVTFSGAVKESGSIRHVPGLKLSDILRLAQPTALADLDRITVLDAEGTLHHFAIRDSRRNDPEIRDGDWIIFEKLTQPMEILVLGEIARPGLVEFAPGLTVKQAIALAGGAGYNADLTSVKVERGGKLIDTVNLELSYDAVLQRGDVVRIALKPNPAYVYALGMLKNTGRYDMKPGMVLTELIPMAGGLLVSEALIEIVHVRTKAGKVATDRMKLADLIDRKRAVPRLEPGDRVEFNLIRSGT